MRIESVPVSTRTSATGRAVLRIGRRPVGADHRAHRRSARRPGHAPPTPAAPVGRARERCCPPTPTRPTREALSTSCPAPANCVAVGAYESGGTTQGLIDTESGGSWTALEAPLPPGAGADPSVLLIDTSCPSVGSCVAVGIYNDAGGHRQGLLLTEAGGSWAAVTAPLPRRVPTPARAPSCCRRPVPRPAPASPPAATSTAAVRARECS